jgi:hypothetical protein
VPWPIGIRILWGLSRSLWAVEMVSYLRDLFGEDADDEQPTLATRRLQVIWTRTGTSPVEDDKVLTTMDFVKLDDGTFSDEWSSGDFETIETALDTLWGTMKSFVPSSYKLAELRWYRKVPGTSHVGPPRRVVARDVAGTASGAHFPPQIALSITHRTALRKHWGRQYWPYLAPTSTANGRLNAGQADFVAGAFQTFFRAAGGAGLIPVVVSDRLQGVLTVLEVQVDDIFDVQRSRRYRTAQHRARLTAEPA